MWGSGQEGIRTGRVEFTRNDAAQTGHNNVQTDRQRALELNDKGKRKRKRKEKKRFICTLTFRGSGKDFAGGYRCEWTEIKRS